MTISGYAIDRHAPSGTGITGVNVYAYPNADESQPAIFLATTTYGAWRSDVAGAYGTPFGPSGFSLAATLPGPGTYLVRAEGAGDPSCRARNGARARRPADRARGGSRSAGLDVRTLDEVPYTSRSCRPNP